MTNFMGKYRIILERQHKNESYGVKLVSSPREDCNVYPDYPRTTVINLNGKKISNLEVYTLAPLRFFTKKASPECVHASIYSSL